VVFGAKLVASHQAFLNFLFMAMFQTPVPVAAAPVLGVAPIHKSGGPGPGPCGLQIGKTFGQALRAVLGAGKQKYSVGVGQFSMANTFVALNAEPSSPCNTDLTRRRAMFSVSAGRRTQSLTWSR